MVFDAYRVEGHQTEACDYHNIHVVYTKEAETADAYIERFAHEHASRYRVTVASSDGLEQIIIRGADASASRREFEQGKGEEPVVPQGRGRQQKNTMERSAGSDAAAGA